MTSTGSDPTQWDHPKLLEVGLKAVINSAWLEEEPLGRAKLKDDERYTQFAAFQNGRLYNNNLRLNATGGNDYWKSGVANPDIPGQVGLDLDNGIQDVAEIDRIITRHTPPAYRGECGRGGTG